MSSGNKSPMLLAIKAIRLGQDGLPTVNKADFSGEHNDFTLLFLTHPSATDKFLSALQLIHVANHDIHYLPFFI